MIQCKLNLHFYTKGAFLIPIISEETVDWLTLIWSQQSESGKGQRTTKVRELCYGVSFTTHGWAPFDPPTVLLH